MKILRPSLLAAGAAFMPLAACNQASAPAPSAALAPGMTSAPGGAGCKVEIDRYRGIMDNDRQMGHVNTSVYNRVAKEIDRAEAVCGGGQDARAVAMIEATKSRYGYR